MKKQCSHTFVSTGEKGQWTVKVKPANSRGVPKDQTVSVTIFKCSECGEIKEYPDTWQKNYIAPDS